MFIFLEQLVWKLTMFQLFSKKKEKKVKKKKERHCSTSQKKRCDNTLKIILESVSFFLSVFSVKKILCKHVAYTKRSSLNLIVGIPILAHYSCVL